MSSFRLAFSLGTVLLATGTAAALHGGRRGRHATPAVAVAVGPDTLLARADSGRIEGSPSAKVWIVEASDFQCPYCKEWHDESYAPIFKRYVATGRVRFAFLNYPFHSHSMQAAEAAMCASAQDKFWPMHEALFATQDTWAEMADPAAFFDSLAMKAGVNAAAWRSCVSTHATQPMIAGDQARLRANGVQSTPTFFVGGERIVGAAPTATFIQAIDSALAKAGGTP
jgi:protein-disulfide isomerase